MAKPALTINEPTATGWLRAELYGDKEIARSHLHAARTLLGTMRSIYGVNERQASGQPGGFYHQWQTLADGSTIHAISNDYHDTIRIYSASAVEPEPEPEEKKDDFKEDLYLWVGLRVKDGCVRPWYALDLWLVEPDGTGLRGVLGSAFGGATWVDGPLLLCDQDNNFTPRSASDDKDYAAYVEEMWDDFGAPGTFFFPDDQFSPGMIYGDHAFEAFHMPIENANTFVDGASVCFSANGLMHQYWLNCLQDFGPHDPAMTDDQNYGLERDFSTMDERFGGMPEFRFGWDATFWIDPFDREMKDEGAPDSVYDARPKMLALTQYLRDHNLITRTGDDQVLEGTYKLVVRAYDTPPQYVSTRAGEAIPDLPAGMPPDPYRERSAACDYADYLALQNVWPPLEVEVEIRIGRDTEQKTFNFELVCESYDERESTTWPFGFGDARSFDECLADGGPNMGGPSYSQWIDIDVRKQTAEVGGEPAERIFATGTWVPYESSPRTDTRFFIYGNVFPVVSASNWEAFAATALFDALEAVTTGVYGCSEMSATTEAELLSLFGGTSHAEVHMYDPSSKTLTPLGPPLTSPADFAINDPPDDSTNFFWYYENAVPYQNQCFNTYGVLVTSVGGFYELSQNFGNTPGFTSPDCC